MVRGRGLRVSSALAIAIAMSGIVACAALAGTAGKEVDPCFDGCDGAASSSSSSSSSSGSDPDEDGSSTSSSSGSSSSGGSSGANDSGAKDATAPVEEDDGGCNCPTGTTSLNGVCTMTVSPAPPLACTAPLQLPSCPKKYLLRLCDTDPTFDYDATCIADGQDHPTTFIKFGVNAVNKWKAVFVGAYAISRMNDQCNRGITPCVTGGMANTTFTITSAPNNSIVPIAKRFSGAACDEISLEMSQAD